VNGEQRLANISTQIRLHFVGEIGWQIFFALHYLPAIFRLAHKVW